MMPFLVFTASPERTQTPQSAVALRDGDWKYLQINGNEFLFNLTQDARERANLAEREPERLRQLRADWVAWDATILPITEDVRSYKISPKVQADKPGG